MARAVLLTLCSALLCAAGCGDSTTTSVLLTVRAEPSVGPVTALRVDIFDDRGAVVRDYRVDAPSGALLSLPDTIVLYPPRAEPLRVRVLAVHADSVIGEGAERVTAREDEQVAVTLTVRAGRLADLDGDGVPDAVDNCPSLPNPGQAPCGGGADGGGNDADGGARDGGDGGARLDGGDGGRRLDSAPRDSTVDTRSRDSTVDTQPRDSTVDTQPRDSTADMPGDTTADAPGCSCPLGCKPGTSVCRALVPSNGVTARGSPALLTLPTGSTTTIDTSACRVGAISGGLQSQGGRTYCVIALQRLVVPQNSMLLALGNHPLVLLVQNDVNIQGLVDVGGHREVPGPGGGAPGITPVGGPGMPGSGSGGGSVCQCGAAASDDCGGGGGGYGEGGGGGGDEETGCASKSNGGATYGNATLVPLRGGSGGAGPGESTAGSGGGIGDGGGGALQISAQGDFRLDGAITSGGGGGTGGNDGNGGGGGGSGGAILLEARRFTGNGLVATNGGGGGAAGGGQCVSGAANNGDDGPSSLSVARGGQSSTSRCGDGGDGGGRASSADRGRAGEVGGGGGGGAVGRVRFNWLQHSSNAPYTHVGKGSTGEAVVQ